MRGHVVVAGSGRMGLDAGLHFLRRGWQTTWLCGDPARRDAFAGRIGREAGRLAGAEPAGAGAAAPRVLLAVEAGGLVAEAPDLLLEAVAEEVELKRALFARLAPLFPAGTPLATLSSSILPGEIHPRCLGAHCFYPLQMTGLVEAVRPRAAARTEFETLLNILRGAALRVIVQEESNAFTVNRLLLPLQALAVRALRAGWPATLVDRASATPLIPFGQLALMDAIGLDVVAPSVENYCRRLPGSEARRYEELSAALRELLAAGKRGRKNRDGFLSGAPLPWAAASSPPGDADDLAREFTDLALSSCSRAVASGDIDAADLNFALSSLFAGAVSLDEARRRARASLVSP